ncbi:MAG: response regulator [Planctomycetes bacterium]|nr:response regulator [Planctomycetota bacterium]
MAKEDRKYKILVVDDDLDVLTSMKMALEETGHATLTAADGLRALELAEAEAPDIVVLDLMLPKRGGFQVLQRLKGSAAMRGKRPLICMVTGNEGMRHKTFAEQNGVDDYLLKPFAMGTLLDIVNDFIAKLDKGIPDAKKKP